MLSSPRWLSRGSLSLGAVLIALAGCDSKSDSADDDASGAKAGGAAGGSGPAGSGGAGGSAGTSSTLGGGGSGATGGAGGGSGSGTTGGSGGGSGSGAAGGIGGSGGAGAVGGSGGDAGESGAGSGGTAAGAGSAGTSSSGTGGGAGTASDPCATALYCDDFESYASAPTGKWTVRTNTASVAIDTTQHASGAQSVKFTSQAASYTSAFIRIQDASVFPVDGNVLYGRMRYRLEAAPTTSVHWTMIQGLGTVPGQTYHAEYRYGGQVPIKNGDTFVGTQLMANYDTPDWYSDKSTPGSDCWHHSNMRTMPVGVWTCVEWKFDGATNGMQLWLDGTAADDLTVMGTGQGCVNAASDYTWTAPTFASIDLGWESYQTDEPRTAWVDDVALSTTRIGCE